MGNTSLHIAAKTGNVNVIDILLQAGASVKAINKVFSITK